MRALAVLLVFVASAPALGGLSGPAVPAPDLASSRAGPSGEAVFGPVTMSVLMFSPPVVVVASGGSVTWTNNDVVAHTVSALAGGTFDLPMPPGRSSSVRFAAPGVVLYDCRLHVQMVGVVVVTP